MAAEKSGHEPIAKESLEEGTLTASEELVRRFQAGEDLALERLWARYLPRLTRWAHGRLPRGGHNSASTDDLVQETFVRSVEALRRLQPSGAQSVFAFFRTIVLNQIRDHIRVEVRRPRRESLEPDDHTDNSPSPLEQLLGRESIDLYERGLTRLAEEDQQIILAFVELGCSDRELAELFEKPSPNAARMARARALRRLARFIGMDGPNGAPI